MDLLNVIMAPPGKQSEFAYHVIICCSHFGRVEGEKVKCVLMFCIVFYFIKYHLSTRFRCSFQQTMIMFKPENSTINI